MLVCALVKPGGDLGGVLKCAVVLAGPADGGKATLVALAGCEGLEEVGYGEERFGT